MRRIPIPKSTEATVLFKSDHLCCVCRDPALGVQVAHIDNNPANNREENLIVLCLNHHDKVSSKSPMSKSYTQEELKKYKKEWGDIVQERRKSLEDTQMARIIRFDGKDINTVYLETQHGALRAFQDTYTFVFLGYDWGNVDIYPDTDRGNFQFDIPLSKINECRKIRVKFSNGSLANEVYLIWDDGRKHHIPDPDTLEIVGGMGNIEIVDYLEFNAIPKGKALISIFTIRTNELLKKVMEEKLNEDIDRERGDKTLKYPSCGMDDFVHVGDICELDVWRKIIS